MTLARDGIAVFRLTETPLLDSIAVPTGPRSSFKNFLTEQKGTHPAFALGEDRLIVGPIRDYFGCDPGLCDSAIVYSVPTNENAKQSQLWHRDPGTDKIAVVFIYLTDVGPENGPFTYIPGTHGTGPLAHIEPVKVEKIPERGIRVTDDEMRRAIPEQHWLTCTGPKHTMIIADTLGYHKGPKVISGHRLVLRFVYRIPS